MSQRTIRPIQKLSGQLLLALIYTMLSASLCETVDPDPGFGNYDRISDALLLTPSNQEEPVRTYLAIANPAYEQLRFYDTYRRRFVESSNVYFPLSVNTGPSTERLASAAADSTYFYALDTSWNQIFAVRTIHQGDALPFSLVDDGFAIPDGAKDLAVTHQDGIDTIWLSLPDRGEIQRYDMNADGSLQGPGSPVVFSEGVPELLHVVDQRFLVATDPLLSGIHIVDVLEDRLYFLELKASAIELSSGYIDSGLGVEPTLIAILDDEHTLAAMRFSEADRRTPQFQLLGYTELEDLVSQVYLPDQRPEGRELESRICCPLISNVDGTYEPFLEDEATAAWATAFHANGSLTYLTLSGTRQAADTDAVPYLFRPIDTNPEGTGPTESSLEEPLWRTPDGLNENRPLIEWQSVDNFGDVPDHPLRHNGQFLHFTWGIGPDGMATNNAFTLYDSEYGFSAQPPTQIENSLLIERPGVVFRISLANAGNWEAGSALTIPLTADVAPLNLDLFGYRGSRSPIGSGATLATSALGSEINILTNSEDNPTAIVRRIFVTTQSGRILELNETETDLRFVIGPRSI